MTNEIKETVRWIFYFEKGEVKSDVNTQEEDDRIGAFIKEDPKGVLKIAANRTDIWVNLSRVKCLVRTYVDLEKEKSLLEQQEQYKKLTDESQQDEQPAGQ